MRMAVNILRANMRRAFGFRFALAVTLSVAALASDSVSTLISAVQRPFSPDDIISVHYFYFNAVSFGGVFSHYFAALLAGLPFAASYAEEHGMLPYLLCRTSRIKYCVSKMVVSALAGGLALFCGALIFMLLLTTKFPLVTERTLFEMQWIPFFGLLNDGGATYFIACLYLAFLKGFLWGGAAMCVSAYLPNKFVVTASPFVLSFILVQIYRLSRFPDNMRLDRLLSGRVQIGSEICTLVTAAVTVVAVWTICAVLFTRKLKKGAE
jgi:hypothetical protein